MENNASLDESLFFLALCDLRGVGFETLKGIYRARISFRSFFTDELSAREEERIKSTPRLHKLREELRSKEYRSEILSGAHKKSSYLEKRRIGLIFSSSARYPQALLDLRDPPPWIFVEGDASILGRPSITAVGSRKASAEGKWLSTYFGYCLSSLGVVTVSGLAEGIDQIVHRASLSAKLPTVAVLGTGILSNYPIGSEELRQEIIQNGGAVVTEYLPNDYVSAKNFVQRNRIQAALGNVVFPIEWGEKSGTAHTVRFAAEAGRSLAFARTPTQRTFDWIHKDLLEKSGRFTLPNDHEAFIKFLMTKLDEPPIQMNLI